MRRVLITGMSATGKSSVVQRLAALGHKAVDADDGYSEWVEAESNPTGANPGRDWMWREDLIHELLSSEDADVLFLAGCAANMVGFYPRFDHIVLLSAPVEVIVHRLRHRTNNPYGKQAAEVTATLVNMRDVEPYLRRSAHYEIDTSAPVDAVVSELLRIAGVRDA